MIYSCQQEEAIEPISITKSEAFVGVDEATAIATVLEFPLTTEIGSANSRTNESTFKDIESVLEIPDENGNPSFYIINYKDDGFIMLSADNRTNPVRAFSLSDKFSIGSSELPNGLLGWLAETGDMIQEIRVLNIGQTESIAQSWDICEMQMTIRPIDDGGDCGSGGGGGCENTTTTVGSLLNTMWGQREGYNDQSPNLGCSGDGRAPTGCVTTAMAQVMKFHEFPNNYIWDAMPDDDGTAETALLLRDIGNAVSMNWGCGDSGAEMSNAASAFSNDFGYQNVNYSSYNHNTVKQQLRWGRPVILSGYQDKNCFLWWCSYETGHAWVCDGYRSTYYCESGTGYLYLHMNWGWYGSNNTYYAYNNWNPRNSTFNHKKEMIYNIRHK